MNLSEKSLATLSCHRNFVNLIRRPVHPSEAEQQTEEEKNHCQLVPVQGFGIFVVFPFPDLIRAAIAPVEAVSFCVTFALSETSKAVTPVVRLRCFGYYSLSELTATKQLLFIGMEPNRTESN